MTTQEAIAELKTLAEHLRRLVEDAHPGLHGWLMACKGTCDRIAEVGKHV